MRDCLSRVPCQSRPSDSLEGSPATLLQKPVGSPRRSKTVFPIIVRSKCTVRSHHILIRMSVPATISIRRVWSSKNRYLYLQPGQSTRDLRLAPKIIALRLGNRTTITYACPLRVTSICEPRVSAIRKHPSRYYDRQRNVRLGPSPKRNRRQEQTVPRKNNTNGCNIGVCFESSGWLSCASGTSDP